jgi:hypothetical protein
MSGETEKRALGEAPASASPPQEFVKLLEYLKSSRGFDFSGYKIPSLMRRVQKRMQQLGIGSYSDYVEFLEVHPDEFLPLFNMVLINVTGFFRDRRPGRCSPSRSCRASWRARGRTSRSAAGAPAAPPARRPTPWPYCSPRPWETTRSSGGG